MAQIGVGRDPFPGKFGSNHDATVKFAVHPDRQLVMVKFGKKVVADDIANYARELQQHPSFRPDFSEIVDLTSVEEMDLQAEEFLRLADEIDPFAYEAKRAFVVRTPVQSHAARMHKVLRTQRSFELFASVEEAERWIKA
jgi:hypothetical protein